jgi:hypothetical protein
MFTFTLIPNKSLTIVTSKNEVLTTRSDHPNWPKIMDAVKAQDELELIRLVNLKETVLSFDKTPTNEGGNITIDNGEVFYKGKKLFGMDIERILQFTAGGFPAMAMIQFLEKKLQNPSYRSIEQLYTFLENIGITLTPEGKFLGYKGVGEYFYSIHAGTLTLLQGRANSNGNIFNGIGEVVECPRNEVCDDFDNACGPGLHVGSLEYATGWGPKVIIVEVDPADVVSVPKDSSFQKLRCRKYKVVGECQGKLSKTYTEEFVDPDDKDELEYSKGFDAGYDDGYGDCSYDVGSDRTDSYVNGYADGYREGQTDISDDEDSDYDIEDGEDEVEVKSPVDSDLVVESVPEVNNYDKGYEDGVKDGKRHSVRAYYDDDITDTDYVRGYNVGYREGRSDY